MKQTLAHDLNTLTRVYYEVGQLRDREIEKMNRQAVIALGDVLDMINEMIDESWPELEQRYIFNDPDEIYMEPDETSAVAFDGNELPF